MSVFRYFWPATTIIDFAEDRALRVAQLLSVSKVAPVFALFCLLTSALIVTVMWDFTQPLLLLSWGAIIAIFPALALPSWWRNRDKAKPINVTPETIARITRQATILGLIWGAGMAFLYPADALPQQMFLAALAAGVGAGGAAGMAAVPSASIGFSLALFLPFLGRILNGGTDIHLGMSALAVLFVVFVLFLARTVHASFLDRVRTQVANDRLVQDLESMQNELLDAIESTSEGFAIFDEDDRLRYYNDKYLDIFGSMRDKIVPGIQFAEIVRATPPPLQCEGRVLGDKEWVEWRLRHHLKGAGSFQQQQSSGHWTLTTDRRTRQGGYVTVHMDITGMKEHEAELAAARDDAESANRAKSEFLTLMSHELRTPLNAVLGFSDILKDQSYGPHSDARYLEYAQDIHDGGSHLLRIINQILDLSKIEAGKFELLEENFDLEFPFNDVRQMMGQLAQEAGLTLSLECDRGIPGLRGDLRTIRQILINLISNAIKFTPTGGVVTVTASRQDAAEGGGLLVRISDTGIGIDKQDIIKALTPFGQIQGPMHRNHQGTGLGLPLVRSFMQLHDGEMSIDSALEQGTTINLFFPRHRLIERNAA